MTKSDVQRDATKVTSSASAKAWSGKENFSRCKWHMTPWEHRLVLATESMMKMMIWVLGNRNTNGYIAPITSRQIIHLIRVISLSILEAGVVYEL